MKPSLFPPPPFKYLALATMLLDHARRTRYPLPEPLRWVGRLAAPIFLFFVVEGFTHTRCYKKYLLRVYAVAVGMGITNTLLRQVAGGFRPDGLTHQRNLRHLLFAAAHFAGSQAGAGATVDRHRSGHRTVCAAHAAGDSSPRRSCLPC